MDGYRCMRTRIKMAEAYTLAPLYLAILLSYISTSCLHGFSYKASNPSARMH